VRTVLAILPPAFAALLLACRVRPPLAAVLALVAGLAVLPVFEPDWSAVWRGQRVASVTGLEVAVIVFAGLWLHEMMERAGAEGRLAAWLAAVTDDPGRRVLLVVLGITPFVESVTGFGVGAIIAFPLLRRMGLEPSSAAAVALLGFVAVPWGALAPGTLIAARLTGVSFHDLGVRSAVVSLPVYLVLGATALVVALGWRASVRLGQALELVVVALALWAGIVVANVLVGTAVAGAVGSLVGVGAVLLLVRLTERRWPPRDAAAGRPALPYLLLVALLLVAQGSAAVGSRLAPTLGMGYAVWTSAATWLVATCLATPGLLRLPRGEAWVAARSAGARWWPVAVTTLVFLSLGALITSGRMADTLAQSAVGLHGGFGAVVPWLAGLGGFLTGSNTGANAMLAGAQAAVARHLGLDVLGVLAVQNVAASVATAVSPARISLVTGLLDGERRPRIRPVVCAVAAALACLACVALVGAVPRA
jgi:lactate permease